MITICYAVALRIARIDKDVRFFFSLGLLIAILLDFMLFIEILGATKG